MATRTHRILGAVAGLLFLGLPRVAAQQDVLINLSDEPGKWKPWQFQGFSAADLRTVGATAADAKTFETGLKHLADMLRACPVWATPMGVDPMLTGSGSVPVLPRRNPPSYVPLSGYLLMGSFEHLAIGKERKNPFVAGETALVVINLNRLPRIGGGNGVLSLADEDGEFLRQPVQTGEMSGFPVYGGDALVITANGRPLWTPVSRERYLKAFIAKRRGEAALADAAIAEQQKRLDAFLAPEAAAARQKKYADAVAKIAAKGDPAAAEHERRYWERDEIDSLAALKKGASRDPKVSPRAATMAGLKIAEDQLAGLSEAERGTPACFVASDDPMKNGLVPMGSTGCTAVVTENRGFFDAGLPRGVPQIIVVSRLADVEKGWKRGRPADGSTGGATDEWTTYEVVRVTDWRRVAELLGK